MNYHIVIPARYASTRLPGKPLLDIAGKPLIQHVYEKALASGAQSVAIATDDKRIVDACKEFKADAYMTSALHVSGTDRVCELVSRLGYADDDIIINLQGDEPMLSPLLIKQLANVMLKQPDLDSATIATNIKSTEEIFNPNTVKVVSDKNNMARYFSRAAIPWNRAEFANDKVVLSELELEAYKKHIGIYAYRVKLLREYFELDEAPTEKLEQLEQLRLLWHGYKMHVVVVETASALGVDTFDDLVMVRKILENKARA